MQFEYEFLPNKVKIISNWERRGGCIKRDTLKSLLKKVVENEGSINNKNRGDINTVGYVFEEEEYRLFITYIRKDWMNPDSDIVKVYFRIEDEKRAIIESRKKEDLKKLFNEILGKEYYEEVMRLAKERAATLDIKMKENKVVFYNEFSESSVDTSEKEFRTAFINLISGESELERIGEDEEYVLRKIDGVHDYRCINCNRKIVEDEFITLLSVDFPYIVCEDCYVDFLLNKTNATIKEILSNFI